MSQFWHAHWAEDGFKPTRLRNWEIPRWHPEWPTRHCTTTKFQAHSNGRLFAEFKRPSDPWSNFKGTWELPLKIDRKTAEMLSKSTEYKKPSWNNYVKKRELECLGNCKAAKVSDNKDVEVEKNKEEKEIKKSESPEIESENLKYMDDVFKDKCKIIEGCKL